MDHFETDADDPCLPRVLSIQSHVVSGYVGNRAAVFPLQLLGFDVDFVNSVQFSNHTKYKTMKGSVLSGDDLRELAFGLASNELLDYDYLLTGYIGSESFLRSVLDLLAEIQRAHPSCRYICDPVLGDEGRYYVPKELVEIYRSVVIPRAYLITPNQFEAELLSGRPIRSEEDAVSGACRLMRLGPDVVVITSTELEAHAGMLHCYATRRIRNPDGKDRIEVNRIIVPKQNAHFTGTGDCTAALLLAWTHLLTESGLGQALQNSIASIQSIIAQVARKQAAALSANVAPLDSRDSKSLRSAEFSVVRGRRYIESPPIGLFAVSTWEEVLREEDT